MKFLKTIIVVLLGALGYSAGAQSIDSLYVGTRGSFIQTLENGHYTSTLKPEYFNIEAWGSIASNVEYRIRHRMNVIIDESNPFRATDMLNLTWHVNPRWSFTVGKDGILIGGYEYDSPPIDVYYYSAFCEGLAQAFSFSARANCRIQENQMLMLQVCNSPLANGFDDRYSYNLAWYGSFTPWWNTIWSTNIIEDSKNLSLLYIALGNRFTIGNLALDIDFFNRSALGMHNAVLSDYTILSKLIWRIGNWNLCWKAGHDFNSALNVDSNGESYDSTVLAGSNYQYWGCGVEYFPLGTEDIRLHLAYFGDNYRNINTISLGLKWRVNILKLWKSSQQQ